MTPGRRPKLIRPPLFYQLPLELDSLAGHVFADDGPHTLLFGPAPRCRVVRGGRPGSDGDVLQVGCVWAKIDYGKVEGGTAGAVSRIRDFPLRPSVSVATGYGRQLFYAFNSPLTDVQLPEWSELMAGLREALAATGDVNPAAVLVLPGSLNHEDPLSPAPCELSDDSAWVRYSPEEVKESVRHALELRRATRPGLWALSGRERDAAVVLEERGASPELIEAVIAGTGPAGATAVSGENAEHERDLWVAESLLETGLEPEEIKALFRSNPHGCGSKWARERHGERYLELIVRTALAVRRKNLLGGGPTPDDDDGDTSLPPNYRLEWDGSLWYAPPASETGRAAGKPVKVSDTVMRISQILENIETGKISVVVEYLYMERVRRTTLSRAQMSDARQLVAALAGEGAPVTSNNARLVTSYLASYEHWFGPSLSRKKVTGRFGRGRSGGPFFLPGAVTAVEFEPAGPGDASLFRAFSSRAGSMHGWLEVMRALSDRSLLIPQAVVLTAFVPPLQSKLQIPNFILDVHGGTSTGKSTSLKLAAAVYGRPADPDSAILQWMNTKSAVEHAASVCGELPLFLDDAQHCPDELKRSVVYMIASGRGKGRGAGSGGSRETSAWHTVALSTSEEALHESSPHEGARGRILSLGPSPPFPAGSGAFVQSLERAATHNHGHAGEVYVRHLNGWTESEWAGWNKKYLRLRAELQREASSNVASRVSSYVAAVQLAGEIVCPLLGLPFKPEVIGAWLMLRLNGQQREQSTVLRALRALADHYVANLTHFAGDGMHSQSPKAALHGASKKGKYVGFLRSAVDAIFTAKKWSQTAVLDKIAEAGALHATEDNRHTKKVRVEGVTHRMVCVKWSALFPDDDG